MISDSKVLNIENPSLQFLQQSTMTVSEELMLNNNFTKELAYMKSANNNGEVEGKRKLICRLRIAPKNHQPITENNGSLEASVEARSVSDSGRQQLSSVEHHASAGRKRKNSLENDTHWSKTQKAEPVRELVTEKFNCLHGGVVAAKKYSSVGRPNQPDIKGQGTLNACKIKQCAGILKKLMTHRFGWVFNEPVDPVKLNIPDYFSIISKPMDLGTIKQKLEGMKYMKPSQFADDIRLTFANAMRYNPPSNDVHIMAKKLSNLFSTSWKVLETKWNDEIHAWHDDIDDQPSRLRPILPKKFAFPDSHSKHVLNHKKKNGYEKGAQMQLQKGAFCYVDSEITVTGNRESLDSNPPVVFGSAPEKNNGDNGHEGKSGDENFQPCPSTPPASFQSEDGQSLLEERLSPGKALRAAMLKSRFADTILKAQQKKLVSYAQKEDPEKIKKERERLEKIQQEERLRIEAEMKAAEAAMKTREAELKLQREKERKEARLALQQMEKTVDIDENSELMRHLQSFGYAEPTEKFPGHGEKSLNFVDEYLSPGSLGNPLAQLGLFMKDDDWDEVLEGVAPV